MYTLYLIALLFSFASGVFLTIYAWTRRQQVGAKTFTALTLASTIFVLSITLMSLSPNPQWAYFWARFRFISLSLLPVFHVMFVFEYVDFHAWLERRRYWILFIVPLITSLLVASPAASSWMLRDWHVVRHDFLYVEVVQLVGWTWVMAAYSYLLLLIGLGLLARQALRSTSRYRWQSILLLVGAIISILANALSAYGVFPASTPNLTPLGLALRSIIFAWALFAFKLLDIVPIAHSAIFKSMSSGVIVIDTQNRIVDMNPAAEKLSNRRLAAVMGQSVETVFAARADLVQRYISVSELQEELPFVDGDRTRYFDFHIAPLQRIGGKFAGRLITLQDITERKQIDREREQLIEMLDAYAHTVAHDLKSPISTLMGYADLLKSVIENPTNEVTEMLNRSVAVSRQAAQIIDELLLFASIRGTAEIPIRTVNLQQTLDSALLRLVDMVNERAAQISISPELPPVLGYAAWIEEMWVNLVSNALKYGGEPPLIEIGAEQKNGLIRCWVHDNGAGLHVDEQEILFKQFVRLEKHQKIFGHGLGLSIVRRIAERLGGQVGVESEIGKGSTFYFSLPPASF